MPSEQLNRLREIDEIFPIPTTPKDLATQRELKTQQTVFEEIATRLNTSLIKLKNLQAEGSDVGTLNDELCALDILLPPALKDSLKETRSINTYEAFSGIQEGLKQLPTYLENRRAGR